MAVCLLFSCREYRHCCYCHSCCHTSRCSNCYWWYIYVPKVKVSSFEFITVTTLQLKVNPKPFFFLLGACPYKSGMALYMFHLKFLVICSFH